MMTPLKEARLNLGLSQQAIAEVVGVRQSTLSYYERGIKNPSDKVKIRLANFYGKSIQELFFSSQNHLEL